MRDPLERLQQSGIPASSFAEVAYNSAYRTPNALWQINPRIDYAINQNNTLVIRYNHTQSSNDGGVGGFSSSHAGNAELPAEQRGADHGDLGSRNGGGG